MVLLMKPFFGFPGDFFVSLGTTSIISSYSLFPFFLVPLNKIMCKNAMPYFGYPSILKFLNFIKSEMIAFHFTTVYNECILFDFSYVQDTPTKMGPAVRK